MKASTKLKKNKKRWKPKAYEGFWSVHCNSQHPKGFKFYSTFCLNDEAFEIFDSTIYRTKAEADSIASALTKTYKAAVRKIYP